MDMFIVLSVLALSITIIAIIYMIKNEYTIIRVNGWSMNPTLKHGQLYLLTRSMDDWYYGGLEVGRIYVICPPHTGHNSIKRLKSIKHNSTSGGFYLWFEGDNKEDSIDSRNYGFLRETDVIGRVVTKK